MAFPEIGQIRKGSPKTENAPGKDLQYFRVTFDEKETEAAAKFLKKYTDKPQEIDILLFSDDIDKSWQCWYEAYTAGRMVARSDGERFIYLVDTKTGAVLVKDGEPYTAYKQGEPVGSYKNTKGQMEKIYCKPTGRLKVVIPELQRAVYMVVLTTSIHDIANISAQLEALKQINSGHLAGIPIVLRRRPKKISTPKADGISRVRYTKWMLSLEADPVWVKSKLEEVKRLALPGNGLDLLPAGKEIVDVQAKDIEPDQPDIEDEETEEEIPTEPLMDEGPQGELFTQSKTFTEDQVKALLENRELGITTANHAINILGQSKKLDAKTPINTVLSWARIYRSARIEGAMNVVNAAGAADLEVFGQ
jgi:hypothetical protein